MLRRGRLFSSPLQFGHLPPTSSAHAVQKVHSKLQMTASVAVGASSRPHLSQPVLISSNLLLLSRYGWTAVANHRLISVKTS